MKVDRWDIYVKKRLLGFDGIILLAFYKFGQRLLVMNNKPEDLSQSETAQYFELYIKKS